MLLGKPLTVLCSATAALIIVAFFPTAIMASSSSSSSDYLNIYGQPLQQCSTSGMALTGFTRTGYCVEQSDDSGSHHICINLSSTVNDNNGGGNDDDDDADDADDADDDGNNGDNFCTVTGQSDWCSSDEMACVDDSSDVTCAIENWCVCQWAFASYLETAGGCDQIQDIECDAINLEAVIAYQSQQQSAQKYADALECLVDRCGIDSSFDFSSLQPNRNKRSSYYAFSPTGSSFFWSATLMGLVVCGTAYAYYRRQKSQKEGLAANQTLLAGETPVVKGGAVVV